jgi:hypothetical protein
MTFRAGRGPGRPNRSRRNFGKEKRSSYEVRDSVEECGNGIRFAVGLQRVCGDESQHDVAEFDHDQRSQAETW